MYGKLPATGGGLLVGSALTGAFEISLNVLIVGIIMLLIVIGAVLWVRTRKGEKALESS